MENEVKIFATVLLLFAYRTSAKQVTFAKDNRGAYLLPNSTTFTVPNGTYRLRVLAVGGGGGGCGGIKQGRGGSGKLAVNIIHVSGPKTINVSIGRGGLGERGHSVESVSNGLQSQFGNYVTALGGRGCTREVLNYSLEQVRGVRHLQSSKISKGSNGMDVILQTSTVRGGEGGILINGSGPFGEAGRGNISAAGGVGYGAGGGAGGAVYLDSGPLIYSGGGGADGVVYVEMVDSVCLNSADVMFAVQYRDSSSEFYQQLQYIKDIVKHFQISHGHMRVALISYGSEVRLKFGFNDFTNSNNLLQGLASIKNDLNASKEAQFANVFLTALIAFHESRSSSKVLVLFTFARDTAQSSLLQNFLSNTRTQGISVLVVAMGKNTSKVGLLSLVEHEHNLFSGDAADAEGEDVPWISDFICQESEPKAKETDSGIETRTLTLSSSAIPQSIKPSIKYIDLASTPSLSVVPSKTDGYSIRQNSVSPAVTASATASAGSSVSKNGIGQRTVQELEKDLDDLLSYNISSIDIKDIAKIRSLVSLAGVLLIESPRIPNASERGVEFMLVKRVEEIGFTVAGQVKPTNDGYKTITLSSGEVDMAVASVNLTQTKELRFPDVLDGDFENNSLYNESSVMLPREAFPSNTSELGQVVWMMFDSLTAMKDATNQEVGTRIMNIITRPQRKGEFEKPVRMKFWLSKPTVSNTNCAFWKQSSIKEHGVWSTEGCTVVQRNYSTVMCHCDHLTSFAVLTRVTRNQPSKKHELPLTIITYVGCGVSILGCILTIITYAFLPSLRSQRTIIHINLVTAVLLAQVLFLVAAFGVKPQTSQVACYAVAVGLFFFFLCVFSWMLAEGIHIYFMVVRVFESGRGRNLYYTCIGWGCPFTVTAIAVAIFQKRLLSKEICWLSVETGAIWSFVGPAIFVMTINLGILAMVLRVTSNMLNEESPSNARSLAKAFVTLLPILGLTWVFGLLAVNNSSVIFEYLFAIFNSLQGFLIFLFYCLKNAEVRREFKRKLHNLEAQRHPNTSTNPSTTPKNPPPEIKSDHHQTLQETMAKESSFETKL